MRVLVVDDHPLFREGIVSLLSARHVDVVGEAGDGLEGVVKAEALRPDVVLMDIRMPGMGGLEATRLLKERLPNVKIVILTISDDDEDLFEAIKSGDPLVAHQASVDHVRAAAKVAMEYLKRKQDEAGPIPEIVAPIALKEPRIGR